MKSFFRTKQLLSLFICLVIVSSLAIVKHGELLEHSFLNRSHRLQTMTLYAYSETELPSSTLLRWHQTSQDMEERCHSTSSSRMVS